MILHLGNQKATHNQAKKPLINPVVNSNLKIKSIILHVFCNWQSNVSAEVSVGSCATSFCYSKCFITIVFFIRQQFFEFFSCLPASCNSLAFLTAIVFKAFKDSWVCWNSRRVFFYMVPTFNNFVDTARVRFAGVVAYKVISRAGKKNAAVEEYKEAKRELQLIHLEYSSVFSERCFIRLAILMVCLFYSLVCLSDSLVCLSDSLVCLSDSLACLSDSLVCLSDSMVCLSNSLVFLSNVLCFFI